jgi:hypothetical protein
MHWCRYKKAALDACDVTWKFGLLHKAPGLCHGAAGNGYAFLCAYRMDGHARHLFRAVQFARFCAKWLRDLVCTNAYRMSLRLRFAANMRDRRFGYIKLCGFTQAKNDPLLQSDSKRSFAEKVSLYEGIAGT